MEVMVELLFEFFGEYVLAVLWGLLASAFGSAFRSRQSATTKSDGTAAIESFRNGFLFAQPFVAMRFFFTR